MRHRWAILYNVGGLFLALNNSASILVYFFMEGIFHPPLPLAYTWWGSAEFDDATC